MCKFWHNTWILKYESYVCKKNFFCIVKGLFLQMIVYKNFSVDQDAFWESRE